MYYSVIFENLDGDRRNTWDDWHLVPTSRPVINPPELKKKTIAIPGGNSEIDITDALTGFPLFENRQGDIEFVVVNDYSELVKTHTEWNVIYSEIMGYLHGKRMRMYLEDDPDYYYEGRFTVNTWKSNSYYSTITISYDVGPYRWWKNNISKEFNVDTTLRQYSFNRERDGVGDAPVSPTIELASTYSWSQQYCTVTFINNNNSEITTTQEFRPSDPPVYTPRFVIYGATYRMQMKVNTGTATLRMQYRKGMF